MSNEDVSTRLGTVVAGSLSRGLEVRLDPDVKLEELAVGRYVTITAGGQRFFGLVTDVSLESTDPRLRATPPPADDALLAEAVRGTAAYGTLHVLPQLVLSGTVAGAAALLEASGPQPVRTIPSHFSAVYPAREEEVEEVFGGDDEQHFWVGSPLDMEVKVRLNLERFAQRSNGVFGKTGTGKTFITRWLHIGLLQRQTAVNLIFDMHNEYGWRGPQEGPGTGVKGLKQLFGSKVAVFTLDEESSRRREVSADHVVRIGYDQIEPEDIETLRQTLSVTDAGVQATFRLRRKYGRSWLAKFLDLDGEAFRALTNELGENQSTMEALRRRLETLERLDFLSRETTGDSVQSLLGYLDERGIHVVLEFGRYGTDPVAYVLVANLLTRRIHRRYVELTERALAEGRPGPRQLVVTIEEGHRFLNPDVAPQTVFGTIAREMRKHHVSLLVVDQRPSGIDEEVMSQLGTKVACLLDNERDVDAVLSGVFGRSELRTVLSRLDSRQQALILGHAVPTPVVIRVREYGSEESYRQIAGFVDAAELARRMESERDLWAR